MTRRPSTRSCALFEEALPPEGAVYSICLTVEYSYSLAPGAKSVPEAVKQPLELDVREVPVYSYVDAGKALNIPPTTIGAWVRGQKYQRKDDVGHFAPVIQRPDPDDTRLSFTNLIEAHVLRSLRTAEDVPLASVREALDVAEESFGVKRLLISRQLRFHAGELFLERYEDLVALTASQQMVMREMFEMYLDRIEYDEQDLPREFFPLTRGPTTKDSPRIISISPFMGFGKPIIARAGISTRAIRSRVDAGETVDHVAADYKLEVEEIHEALRYEVAA